MTTSAPEATTPLDVREFNQDTFFATLAEHKYVTVEQLNGHRQANYLARYLRKIGVVTMVVEPDYTDPHFLDDVAAYYVRSHEDYPRRCVRLHFFTERFDRTRLRNELLQPTMVRRQDGTEVLFLQSCYRGFIVVRPLPIAVIGRTVLATYPLIEGRRFYPGVMRYTAHLYGTELAVDSLAYQQQDTVLAACATVALWSAFQKASHLFGTVTPTPAEITRAATSAVFATRSLPSRGLTLQQMTRAIAEIGLEPEVIPCTPDVPVVSAICAYLDLGLPIVLNVDIETFGHHAVTVVGYSVAKSPRPEPEYDAHGPVYIPQLGARVDQLYVHDDNAGPFAKLKVRARPTREAPFEALDDGDDDGDEAGLEPHGTSGASSGGKGGKAGSRHDTDGNALPLESTTDTSEELPIRTPLSPVLAESISITLPAMDPAAIREDDIRRVVDAAVRAAVKELAPHFPAKPSVYFVAPKVWIRRDGSGKLAKIEPKQIIVPVYHKVRLAFMDLQSWLVQMTTVVPLAIEEYDQRAEWRTRLTTLTAYKREVRDGSLPEADRERILLMRLPRFLWRSVLYEGGEARMELVFDATGMQRSFPLLDALYYNDEFREKMRGWVYDPVAEPLLTTELREFLQKKT